MKEGTKSQFQFKNFHIKHSSIDIKDGDASDEFSVGFEPKGMIYKDKSIFQLHLKIEINDKNKVVKIEVYSIANFYFDDEINKDILNNYFYVNAPAILFPYLRAFISTLTNLSGLRTVTLPTLNLTSLREELESNTSEVNS